MNFIESGCVETKCIYSSGCGQEGGIWDGNPPPSKEPRTNIDSDPLGTLQLCPYAVGCWLYYYLGYQYLQIETIIFPHSISHLLGRIFLGYPSTLFTHLHHLNLPATHLAHTLISVN